MRTCEGLGVTGPELSETISEIVEQLLTAWTPPRFNKLKTTPTPNKNGSYGINGGGPYAIEVGVRMP